MKQKFLIGRKDVADFPSFGLKNVPVKIDTGAYTSSIHCDAIELVERNNRPVLEVVFKKSTTGDSPTFYFETFSTKKVRSSSGRAEKRFFIDGEIVLFNQTFSTVFSLTKRVRMKYPVLLGRKLLNKGFVVDSSKVKLSNRNRISRINIS